MMYVPELAHMQRQRTSCAGLAIYVYILYVLLGLDNDSATTQACVNPTDSHLVIKAWSLSPKTCSSWQAFTYPDVHRIHLHFLY